MIITSINVSYRKKYALLSQRQKSKFIPAAEVKIQWQKSKGYLLARGFVVIVIPVDPGFR